MGWILHDLNGSLIEADCKQIKRKWEIIIFNPPLMVESDANGVVNSLKREFEDI